MPAGLPDPCRWPKPGEEPREWHCYEDPKPGDVVTPEARHSALELHLDEWAEYPGLCRVALEENNAIWRVKFDQESQIEASRAVEREIKAGAGKWPAQRAYLWIVGALATGGAVGFAVGAIVIATQ